MTLKKEAVLFSRDGEEKLIPEEVELVIEEDDEKQAEFVGETIIVLPIIKGELKKLFSRIKANVDDNGEEKEDIDGEIILNYCVKPKFEKQDLPYMKDLSKAIVNTILYESGVNVLGNKSRKKAVDKKEDDFAKNSEKLNQSEKKAI